MNFLPKFQLLTGWSFCSLFPSGLQSHTPLTWNNDPDLREGEAFYLYFHLFFIYVLIYLIYLFIYLYIFFRRSRISRSHHKITPTFAWNEINKIKRNQKSSFFCWYKLENLICIIELSCISLIPRNISWKYNSEIPNSIKSLRFLVGKYQLETLKELSCSQK